MAALPPSPLRAATIGLDDAMLPSGLQAGDVFHFVFLTPTRFDRTDEPHGPGDISYYNNIVNGVAANSSIQLVRDLQWSAIVSVDGGNGNFVHARDNALVTGSVHLLDSGGTMVASGFADLWDGSILTPIIVGESGQLVALGGGTDTGRVWTGSNGDGTANTSWPLGRDAAAITGIARPNELGGNWINNGAAARRGTSTSLFYYALSEPITVVPEPSKALLFVFGALTLALRRRR